MPGHILSAEANTQTTWEVSAHRNRLERCTPQSFWFGPQAAFPPHLSHPGARFNAARMRTYTTAAVCLLLVANLTDATKTIKHNTSELFEDDRRNPCHVPRLHLRRRDKWYECFEKSTPEGIPCGVWVRGAWGSSLVCRSTRWGVPAPGAEIAMNAPYRSNDGGVSNTGQVDSESTWTWSYYLFVMDCRMLEKTWEATGDGRFCYDASPVNVATLTPGQPLSKHYRCTAWQTYGRKTCIPGYFVGGRNEQHWLPTHCSKD